MFCEAWVSVFAASRMDRSFLLAKHNYLSLKLSLPWTFLLRFQFLICDLDRQQILLPCLHVSVWFSACVFVCVCACTRIYVCPPTGFSHGGWETLAALQHNQHYDFGICFNSKYWQWYLELKSTNGFMNSEGIEGSAAAPQRLGMWKATSRLDCPSIFLTLIKCIALTDFWYIADGCPCNLYGSQKPNQYEHRVFILTLGVKGKKKKKNSLDSRNFYKVQLKKRRHASQFLHFFLTMQTILKTICHLNISLERNLDVLNQQIRKCTFLKVWID